MGAREVIVPGPEHCDGFSLQCLTLHWCLAPSVNDFMDETPSVGVERCCARFCGIPRPPGPPPSSYRHGRARCRCCARAPLVITFKAADVGKNYWWCDRDVTGSSCLLATEAYPCHPPLTVLNPGASTMESVWKSRLNLSKHCRKVLTSHRTVNGGIKDVQHYAGSAENAGP